MRYYKVSAPPQVSEPRSPDAPPAPAPDALTPSDPLRRWVWLSSACMTIWISALHPVQLPNEHGIESTPMSATVSVFLHDGPAELKVGEGTCR